MNFKLFCKHADGLIPYSNMGSVPNNIAGIQNTTTCSTCKWEASEGSWGSGGLHFREAGF